ncbi:hypothetical protein ACUWN6_000186 [Vibrio alginolyticus]
MSFCRKKMPKKPVVRSRASACGTVTSAGSIARGSFLARSALDSAITSYNPFVSNKINTEAAAIFLSTISFRSLIDTQLVLRARAIDSNPEVSGEVLMEGDPPFEGFD